MTIVLPWPSAALSPNARGHWGKRSRAAKVAREAGFYATKEAKVRIAVGDVPVLLDVAFYPPTKARHDHDNLLARCKASLDGIAAALGVDDTWFRPTPRIAGTHSGGKVEVTIL